MLRVRKRKSGKCVIRALYVCCTFTCTRAVQVEKQKYRTEKKRAAKELQYTLKDPSVIVMADWLKVRGTLKSWTRLWCVIKPGLLLLYKSSKAKVRTEDNCYSLSIFLVLTRAVSWHETV